jgi:hypothetical protein
MDGGLSPEETSQVEQHLAHCGECFLTVRELREIQALPVEPAPEESLTHLQTSVHLALEREQMLNPPSKRSAARILTIALPPKTTPHIRRVPLAAAACFVLCFALPALGYVAWKSIYYPPAPAPATSEETATASLAPEHNSVETVSPASSGTRWEVEIPRLPALPLRSPTFDLELRKEIENIAVRTEVQAALPNTDAKMEIWARAEYPHILWLYDVLTKPEYGINWNGVPASIPTWAEQFYPDAATRPQGWRALVIYSGDAFRLDFPQTAEQPNVLPRLQSLQLAAAVAGFDTTLASTDGQVLPALVWADGTEDTPSKLRLTPHAAGTESIAPKSQIPTPADIPEEYPKQLTSIPTLSVSVLRYTWASSTLLSVSSKNANHFNALANQSENALTAAFLRKNTPRLSYLTDQVSDAVLYILERRNTTIQQVQNTK